MANNPCPSCKKTTWWWRDDDGCSCCAKSDCFIPHGTTCEADENFPDTVARCGERAVGVVRTGNADRFVCQGHLDRWIEQKKAAGG